MASPTPAAYRGSDVPSGAPATAPVGNPAGINHAVVMTPAAAIYHAPNLFSVVPDAVGSVGAPPHRPVVQLATAPELLAGDAASAIALSPSRPNARSGGRTFTSPAP